jgi:xanthine dehydrogenase accessory factor
MPVILVIRGGGDLASGTAYRLFRAGLHPIITELPQPLAVRRSVSFAESVYAGSVTVEGVKGRKARDLSHALKITRQDEIPVLVDPHAEILQELINQGIAGRKIILVDARMKKSAENSERPTADLVIGLGPGFIAGENCDAAIETMRGHFLGRVLWQGAPEGDTGVPDTVAGRDNERVLRAPVDGILVALAELGDLLDKNQPVAQVSGMILRAPFQGVLRGLLRPGITVSRGLKIGDIDPRGDPRFFQMVSDKSLAVGGGVLEAILSRRDLRPFLWD